MKKLIRLILITAVSLPVIAQVRNSDKPLRGQWDFKIKKAWEVSESGSEGFSRIQNIAAANDGRVYIVDQKNYKIYIFSKNGQFISSFGKRGEGPGEIRRLFGGAQIFLTDNRVIIVDLDKIHRFSLQGKYLSSYKYPVKFTPVVFLSETIFISAPKVISLGAKGEMNLYNHIKKSRRLITEYSIFKKATDGKGGQFRRSIVIGSITPMMVVKARNGRIFYGMSDRYQITRADQTGKILGSFSVAGRGRVEVAKKFLDSVAEDLKTAVRPAVLKRLLAALPKKASFFWDFFIDKYGRIYTLVSNPNSPNLQRIDIFSPRGQYLYSSMLRIKEGNTIKLVYLEDELLLLAVEDGDGVQSVIKYRVSLPPE